MSDNIVSLVESTSREEDSYLKILYVGGSVELFKCDSFGESETLPGFIMIWKNIEKDNSPTTILRTLDIRRIDVLTEGEYQDYIFSLSNTTVKKGGSDPHD